MLKARHIRLALALSAGMTAALPAAARAEDTPYVPGQLIVRYAPGVTAHERSAATSAVATSSAATTGGRARVLHLRRGTSVPAALSTLRHRHGIVYAAPNFVARVSSTGGYVPNDRGRGSGGWERFQWNFIGHYGIGAPTAWARARAAHDPGARGVRIAVIDTGIAYRNWRGYLRSPDFARTHFSSPADFVSHNRFPLDREGHGTHVAGTIAEQTNNRYAVTGLAYESTIIPVRVLDHTGSGDAATIARGIRYAVAKRAKIINLSFEFGSDVTESDIPDVVSALNYAHQHGVLVVAAAGNEFSHTVVYPARSSSVLSVGATTSHGCLADYSNYGRRLDLVAPGGGNDADLAGDSRCNPFGPLGRPIYQMTFRDKTFRHFGLPSDYVGTSMASPHVAGTAALVIASGVIGHNPSPDALRAQLMRTARDLGEPGTDLRYGAGLLSASAATAPAP
jgi:serine protease